MIIIKPMIIYGCETWESNKKNRSAIAIFKGRAVRRIYGGKELEDF